MASSWASNINWEAAVIVTKDQVDFSWDLVCSVLGKSVNRKVILQPFQANQAVWWPGNQEEMAYFLRLGRGFFDKGVMLTFVKWPEGINNGLPVFDCCYSWVRISGLPWNLWNKENFETIGEQCGGLLDISHKTRGFRDLSAALMKVRGPEGGFIKGELSVRLGDKCWLVKVQVVSVDIAAFGQLGKRNYAQVVVDGVGLGDGQGSLRE